MSPSCWHRRRPGARARRVWKRSAALASRANTTSSENGAKPVSSGPRPYRLTWCSPISRSTCLACRDPIERTMNSTTEKQRSLPLEGLVVVELGHSVAAPFAGQILGDLGAQVVKVEKADGGDDARSWGPPFLDGTSITYLSLNRNKHSVSVNLKDVAQLE